MSAVMCDKRTSAKMKEREREDAGATKNHVWFSDRSTRKKTGGKAGGGRYEDGEGDFARNKDGTREARPAKFGHVHNGEVAMFHICRKKKTLNCVSSYKQQTCLV